MILRVPRFQIPNRNWHVRCSDRFAYSVRKRGEENQMAKIARFHKLGGPEVLKIEDLPSRKPSKGEVRLSVQAIGLNRAGIHVYAWVLLGTSPTACDVGIRSFWDRYRHRSKCRPQ